MKSMTEATEAFINGADWLTEHDQAAVTALRHAARELDDRFTASLLAQWRAIYNELRDREVAELPAATTEADEFLEELGI